MKTIKTPSGRFEVIPQILDRTRNMISGSYTPQRIKSILDAANGGDIRQMCLCGREILERNWDVIAAMEQRADALSGCVWDVHPGDETPAAKEAADAFTSALKNAGRSNGRNTFQDFIKHSMDAVVMPFEPTEIIWGEGGTLDGFLCMDPWDFSLRSGFVPRLITDEYPEGLPEEMQKNQFVFHQFQKKMDPARQGKIRVLAWLHCFQNWPIKDLFSFIERFGMPFVVARVDQNAWENERSALHQMIRNFGPNGGGVFTKAAEVQLLNASNTGSDNVYFKALEFTHNAIYTLIVGQLASSSDSTGMSNGDAQSAVRQDILEADAKSLEATVYAQIAAPWTAFQFGPDVAVPEIHFQVEPAKDLGQLATVVNTLSQAGFKADEAELSERFGMRLHYEAPADNNMGMGLMPNYQNTAPAEQTEEDLALDKKYTAMGVAIRAGLLTATPEIEERVRQKLGLPALPEAAKKAWEEAGGIRRPTTLKTDTDTEAMTAEPVKKKDDLTGALEEWLGPLSDGLADAVDLSDEELDKVLRSGKIGAPGDSSRLEKLMTAEMERAFDGTQDHRK